MIKKLAILVAIFVGGSTALSASTISVSCPVSGATDPATFAAGGTNATFSGAVATCSAFTIPIDDTLTGVEMLIDNSFSGGIEGQTNNVGFLYAISGFDAASSLQTDSYSNSTSASDGTASDLGGIIAQAPGGVTGCAQASVVSISCNEITPVTTSFSVTGTSEWFAGGLTRGGEDEFNVTEIYTVVPTVGITPEPCSLALLGGGLLGLAYVNRRKRMI